MAYRYPTAQHEDPPLQQQQQQQQGGYAAGGYVPQGTPAYGALQQPAYSAAPVVNTWQQPPFASPYAVAPASFAPPSDASYNAYASSPIAASMYGSTSNGFNHPQPNYNFQPAYSTTGAFTPQQAQYNASATSTSSYAPTPAFPSASVQQPDYNLPPPNPIVGYGAPFLPQQCGAGGYGLPPSPQKLEPEYPPQMYEDGPAFGGSYGGQQKQGGYAPQLTPGQPGWNPQTAHPLPPPSQGPQHSYQQQQEQQYGAPQQRVGFTIPPWARIPHPKYVSLTCSAMPNSNDVRTRANVPLGVILRPLADPPSSASAQPLHVINPVHTGVIRCKECRAYVNPFIQFLDGGARWCCNLCGLVNDVPQAYFSAVDPHTGRRADLDERPELVHGSVEIVAPVDYMVRQPMPPCYFFVIDVSEAAVASGMLQTLSETVMSVLDKLPGDKRTLIGFMTFDSTVHFYTLKAGADGTPQMFVMADLEDVFLPVVSQDLLVNLEESRSQVEQLVSSLPSMHAKTRDVETAFGPALEGALQVMTHIGGKMLLFLAGLPSLGKGRLTNRENLRALNTDKEHLLLATPAVDFYERFAIKLTKNQICADLFLFQSDANANASFLDVATLNVVNKLTGGQCYLYQNYHSDLHGRKFHKELTYCLIRTQGWEAVVRVRASRGVRVSEFHGNFFMRGSDLLALPCIDSDKAFVFELCNDESLIMNPTISIQAALLYTTSSGERRIRVHTTCIHVTQSIGDMFERVNVNAITNLIAKQAVISVLKDGFEKAREMIRNRCVALLRTHHTALAKQQATPSTELNILPLMTLGLLKNATFKEGHENRADVRAFLLAGMYTMVRQLLLRLLGFCLDVPRAHISLRRFVLCSSSSSFFALRASWRWRRLCARACYPCMTCATVWACRMTTTSRSLRPCRASSFRRSPV